MVYIHSLQGLNPKSLEADSIQVIREIKKDASYPVSEEKMKEKFSSFFISDIDMDKMKQSSDAVIPAIEKIKSIIQRKDPVNEPINLSRTIQVLNEMPAPLQGNMDYAEGIKVMQDYIMAEITAIVNNIPKLKTNQEKQECNNKIKKLFRVLLRNDGMVFNSNGIINEAHIKHIKDLSESMDNGYFFHFTLEEELKKTNFRDIKSRIPAEKLTEAESIQNDIKSIRIGVERAYEVNLRTMGWAILLYSYVKWVLSK